MLDAILDDFSPIAEGDLPGLPEDVQQRILAVQEKAGFVPNVFLTLARRPEEFRAFFAYHDALMERSSPMLGKAEREMIVVATSSINRCLYCVVAHGAILRILSKDTSLSERVATNFEKAGLSVAHTAMLQFAREVAEAAPDTDYRAEGERLMALGFSMDDVWDIVAITAFFAMSNRLANGLGMLPNKQFYDMGRGPFTRKGSRKSSVTEP